MSTLVCHCGIISPSHTLVEIAHDVFQFINMERFCAWWYVERERVDIFLDVEKVSHISLVHFIPPDCYIEEVRMVHIFAYSQKTQLFTT